MDFFAKMQNAASNAFEQTKIGASKAKLSAEVLYIEDKIKSSKQEFGVCVFNSIVKEDVDERDRILAHFKANSDEMKGQIAAKNKEIADLEQESKAISARD